MPLFAIVEFQESKSVAVIPSSWFCDEEENQCYWPSRVTDAMRITKMVSKQSDPDSTWPAWDIRVLGKAGDYSRARQKAVAAEDTSNVDTDTEERPRKKRRNTKYLSSDDDSEPEVSHAPSSSLHREHLVPTAPVALTQRSKSSSPPLPSLCTSQQSPLPTCCPTSVSDFPYSPSSSAGSSLGHSTPHRGHTLQREGENAGSSADGMEHPTSGAVDPTVPLRKSGLKKILTLLEGIKQTQRIHTALIQEMSRQGDTTVEDFALPGEVSFPLSSKQELEAFDDHLQDEAFKKGLVRFLADFGGRTLEETLKRILAHLLTDEFATTCNISGRNKKTGLGNTRLFDVVCRAVKKNRRTSTSNRKDVETGAAKWLIGSRDRCGVRRKPLPSKEASGEATEVDSDTD